MKRAIALTLALVLCLSLCACGGTDPSSSNDTSESATGESSTDELKQYTGIWSTSTTALYLYEDGVALFVEDQSGDTSLMTTDATHFSGTWDIRDGYIIFYHEKTYGSTFSTYAINDGTLVDCLGNVYRK